jgi:hypothetical protein
MIVNRGLLSTLFALIALTKINSTSGYKVIYAINCGGEEHTDSNGIKYDRDPLSKVGTASNFGQNLPSIGRVSKGDEILYQTER